MSKSKTYPNELFKTVDEYCDFAFKHRVFGAEALALKKEMTKQVIPLPRIKNGKRKLVE